MLINLVGCDGCGKSTQIGFLLDWFKREQTTIPRIVTKKDVFDFKRFPEAAFFGCSYKELMYGKLPLMKKESRAIFLYYLFSLSMSHYPPEIGETVIVDGYWHKHAAAEAAMGVDLEWLMRMGQGLPASDLTIFFDITPDIIVHRRKSNDYGAHAPYECGCQNECSDEAFLLHMTKVYSNLKDMSVSLGWKTIDGTRSRRDVFEDLKDIICKFLELD